MNRTNPTGRFDAYCIPVNTQNEHRVRELVAFLDRHHIRCEQVEGSQRISQAWEYGTNQERAIVAKTGDLMINARQTHSGILNVLFDPNPVLSDSLTYDITTWSVPYAYGLQTFGLQSPAAGIEWSNEYETTAVKPAYGWAIQRRGLSDTRFVAQAMKAGFRFRTNAEPIGYDDFSLDRGTSLILAADQTEFDPLEMVSQLSQLSEACSVELIPLPSGHPQTGPDMGSDDVWLLGSTSRRLPLWRERFEFGSWRILVAF